MGEIGQDTMLYLKAGVNDSQEVESALVVLCCTSKMALVFDPYLYLILQQD